MNYSELRYQLEQLIMEKSTKKDLSKLLSQLQQNATLAQSLTSGNVYVSRPSAVPLKPVDFKYAVGDLVTVTWKGKNTGKRGVIESLTLTNNEPSYQILLDEGGMYQYLEDSLKAWEPTFAVKIEEKELEKVSLRPDVKNDILALLSMSAKAKTIFEDWGLGETIEYGKGMTALFYGPPGTWKTWTAHCMARAVGRELMVVSCADIQSSMAGETSKNIVNAFSEARKNERVLLLDEADSFLGDRRYMGMIIGAEINTLLTEIEKFAGILILTTNQIGNLDPALERRIALIVEFKNPTLEERKRIWSILIPSKLPLHEDVSIDKLAAHKLTGGFIKNVLIHAARLAAAKDEPKVRMEHFETAIARTHESQGKLGTRDGSHGRIDYKMVGESH